MEWNIVPEFCALVILVIIWIYEKRGSNIPSLKNRLFLGCIVITFMCITSNIISTTLIYNYKEVPNWLTWLVTTIYFIFIPLMGLVYFYYVVATIYTGYNKIRNILIVTGIPTFCLVIAMISNFYTKIIFDISKDLGYVRGKFIIVTYLIFYFYCFLIFCIIIYRHRKIEQKTGRVFLVFPIVATIIVAFQQNHPNIILSGFASSCSLLIVYLYLQNRQIYIDYLTKVPNRWELLNMLDFLLQGRKKIDKISLIVVSIRDFKSINDRYGQQVGDTFLQKISEVLCDISPRGSVYRFNGDEFALLLSKSVDINLENYVSLIQEKMNRMWDIGEYSSYLSVAIGTVICEDNDRTVESIIQSAEYAVEEAKKRKNNYVCFYDKDMFIKMERKKKIVEILKQKLHEKSFEMYYQPIYATSSNKFLYAESLIRMNDTPIGPIYPSEFIPIAEETGLIIEMTYVILDKVCKFIKSVIDNKIPIECVHVNFSPIQFSQMNLEQRVMEIIKKNGIPSNTIKIEFTESAVADSTDSVIKFSSCMENYGIRMGLDDFGTGYSNIATVMSIPFHAVKLDKSFVWMAMKDESAATVARHVIGAFKAIGMQVVAEGVETKDQMEEVIEFGVDQIQGYYFSKPLPSEEALQFLKENNI